MHLSRSPDLCDLTLIILQRRRSSQSCDVVCQQLRATGCLAVRLVHHQVNSGPGNPGEFSTLKRRLPPGNTCGIPPKGWTLPASLRFLGLKMSQGS